MTFFGHTAAISKKPMQTAPNDMM